LGRIALKPEVRKIAAEMILITADKKDSQGLVIGISSLARIFTTKA